MNSKIILNSLFIRRQTENPIIVGMIGFGFMGSAICDQLLKWNDSIKLTKIYNRTPDKLKGLSRYDIEIVDDISEITNDPSIDIIIECTGTINFAFNVTMNALQNRKHVLSMNCELQATFGEVLYSKACEMGVIYSDCDGDQPGMLSNLVSYVELIGLRPLVIGSVKGFYNRYATQKDMIPYQKNNKRSLNMLVSATDGTKMSIEQAVIANHIDGNIDRPGMNGFDIPRKEPLKYCLKYYDYDSLINRKTPLIDYVMHADDPSVYVIASAESEIDKIYLETYKVGKGPLYFFSSEYHLCHFDIISSIINIVDFKNCIVASRKKNVEVITMAKRDLKCGEILDGIGGDLTYGICFSSQISKPNMMLPIGLSGGATLLKDINKDTPLSYMDVSVNNLNLFDN